MKKFLAVMASLALSVSMMAGCSSSAAPSSAASGASSGADGEPLKIAYTCQDLSNTYFVEVCNGVKERCEELGYEVIIHDGKADAANRKILLRIPSGLLSSLTLSTTNGDLLLPALEVTGSLSLSANNGDIRFEKLGVGNALDLKAKNGDIRGTVAGSYEEFSISCESKKGESNLPSKKDGAPKALTVANNNGDITIEFAG